MIHSVVAGALIGPRGILLAHRSPHRRYYPGCWDLPGGHVEKGEEPRDALVRELREEMGVEAAVHGDPWARVIDSPGADDGMNLQVWVVTRWSGEFHNMDPQEHDQFGWFDADALSSLKLAHPGYPELLGSLLRHAHH